MDIRGTIKAPILKLIADEVLALLKNDAALRDIQSQNAQRACYGDQPVGGVTGATIYQITQALAGSEHFYSLVITFGPTSGTGRYDLGSGLIATAAGDGVSIPAGGGVLTIIGHDNIRNFRMVAETGQTLLFARYLFK